MYAVVPSIWPISVRAAVAAEHERAADRELATLLARDHREAASRLLRADGDGGGFGIEVGAFEPVALEEAALAAPHLVAEGLEAQLFEVLGDVVGGLLLPLGAGVAPTQLVGGEVRRMRAQVGAIDQGHGLGCAFR